LINKNLRDLEQEDGSAVRKPSLSNASSVTISNHKGLHIILPTSASHATSSGTVSNLRHCVVDLSPPTIAGEGFASLTLKNIKNSLVVCGRVNGPIHITGVENSVIVTSCRQYRMHSSKNVEVYLHCSSRPIIEDCEGIRFARLPEAYVSLASSFLHLAFTNSVQSTSETSSTPNQYDQIDDFKWLKSEPSPHFSLISPVDYIKEEVWRDTVPGGVNVSLDDVLRAVSVLP
jgi:hypothetical protein